MTEAVMATLRGETVYAITEDPGNQRPYIDPVGIYKISDLLLNGEAHRYIWDEPEPAEIEIEPEVEVTIDTSKDLPFTPEKSELEGFAVHDPLVKKSKPGPKPKIDTGKLMALHNAGWDDAKIADELNVNIKTVRKYLREAREDGEIDD